MQRGEAGPRRDLGVTSAPVGSTKRQNTEENTGLVHFAGAHVGKQKKVKSVPMKRGTHFVLHRSIPMQHGTRFSYKGVRKVMKIMVFVYFQQ